MTDPKLPVLIGDHEPKRAEWLSRFLYERYGVTAQTADTYAKVRDLVAHRDWSVIFLANTLPLSDETKEPFPDTYFLPLKWDAGKARFVCVVTQEPYPTLLNIPVQVIFMRLPSSTPTTTEQGQVLEALKPLDGILTLITTTIEEVESISDWRGDDRVLHEQIRSLSLDQDLKDADRLQKGKENLYYIIRDCIDCRTVEKIKIKSLTQGKSGARVFHLTVKQKDDAARPVDGEGKREYVLKLSEERDVWKLESEVDGYLQAKKSAAYSRYKRHIPALETPQRSKLASTPVSKAATELPPEEYAYIATKLPWNAIYYDFLGGSQGAYMSLETALISAPDKLRAKVAGSSINKKFSITSDEASDVMAFRVNFMDTLLTALCDIWYLGANDKGDDEKRDKSRERKRLWDTEDAPDRRYEALPPYQLAARTKRWTHELLESEEAEMGGRVFRDWGTCRDKVMALIQSTVAHPPPGCLGEEMPVVLTSVHGDLNASNVFLWLREASFPFLIDLPFYQPRGHALQDFARLEVDIKFALMDRQKESPASRLAAYDYSPEQAHLWQELEDYLLDNRTREAGDPYWRSEGYQDNVKLTYRLVKLIRDSAERVQQQPLADSANRPVVFMDEYLPALLYHTIRAATYPSLSIFKRLLAIYSAGSILQRLGV